MLRKRKRRKRIKKKKQSKSRKRRMKKRLKRRRLKIRIKRKMSWMKESLPRLESMKKIKKSLKRSRWNYLLTQCHLVPLSRESLT